MKKIKSSAPGKMMLLGEHAVIYGRPCIVTAIDKRVRVFLKPRKDKKISLTADSLDFSNFPINLAKPTESYPKSARFTVATLHSFNQAFGLPQGFDLITKSELAQSGFGSSAAVTVALTKALLLDFHKKLTKKKLFDFCYSVVLEVQGVGSGFDVASAVWGGTLSFIKGGVQISPLQAPGLQIVVGHTGVKADSPAIVKEVNKLVRKKGEWANRIFDEIGETVKEAASALESNNLLKLGRLMDRNQELLAELGVSSKELDALIRAARKGGAYGAKLSGAGRGDFMIALVDQETKLSVEKAVQKAGGKTISVKVNSKI